MGFFRHFKALWRKNFIIYKRNWKGSLCELCCPIFLMCMVLVLRIGFKKEKVDPTHLLDQGYIFYDKGTTGTTPNFMGYTIFDSKVKWFNYCKERDDTPNRTKIALAPSGNAIVTALKAQMDTDLAPYGLTVQLYESRDEIMNIIGADTYEYDGTPGICFGAAIEEASTDSYTVKMIFDDTITERTRDPNMPNQELKPVDEYQRAPNNESFTQYKIGGYTYLQNLIANKVLQSKQDNSAYISMVYTGLKTSEYNNDEFANAATFMWSFFMLIVFIAPLYRLVYTVVLEKEVKIREAMKIMGLTDFPYWLSWFTYYLIITTVQCSLMILILIPVFEYSSLFLVFLYLWLYGMTMFAYGVFVSAFFSSAKTAAIVATMSFYATSFIVNIVQDPAISEAAKTICSLIPSVGAQLAAVNLLKFEESGIGLTFSNANELYLNYRFGTCLWMYVLTFFVLLVAGLYLENIVPAAVGVRKKWYYPFTRSYWFSPKKNTEQQYEDQEAGKKSSSNKIANSNDASEENMIERVEVDPDNFEEIPEYLRRKEDDNQFIKISNLKKKFDNFKAIDGLNAVMYEDQIFALLGHNGAGKTTSINVLSGMMSATGGKATIYGFDVETEMKELRKIMGICPQHNILYPKLTVKEHLSIFADFKGMPRKEIDDEIEQILIDLNMEHKKNTLSKDLSGGYKRKLSLAIALVGGSKVVFLDEPSSGMDVTARREMWDMLKKYKNDRLIILTTHYMEEADSLGDRIGIMSRGKMLCCGTPDFLKNRYGQGYNLTIVKNSREENPELERFITDKVPGSKKVSEVTSEATYLLPKDASDNFPEFFKAFDSNLENLNVSNYGVSMTTLEEVFLSVENGGKNDAEQMENIKKRISNIAEEEKEKNDYSIAKNQVSGMFPIFWMHFVGLIIKRFILSKRNFKGFLTDILVPSLLIIMGLGLATIEFYIDSAPRTLEPSLFPTPQRVITNADNIANGGVSAATTLLGFMSPQSAFSFSTVSAGGSTDSEKLQNFDNELYNAAQVQPLEPYRYGHYYFHSINTGGSGHQYQVVSFVNTTSQEAHVAFPHFMYQAILKNSIGSNFEYKVINDPMPIVQTYKDQEKGGNSLFTGFVLGIAFALIPTSIIGFILHERVNNLVHQQIISGMNKVSYWTANFVFDICKAYIPVLVAIAFLYIFQLDYSMVWLLFLLFPLALIPYTYATSFLFSEEATAQNFTIIHHFFISGLGPIIIFVLRLLESTQSFGDVVMWFPRVVPSYNAVGGMVTIALKETLANDRNKDPPGALDIGFVAGGDLIFLFLHMFFWTFLLILIESGAFSFCRSKGKHVQDEQVELDDDVVKEQQRVENTSEDQLAVKADHLRKTYGNLAAVKDVCFSLEFGDCFALLGTNGAGKTSTFKMLTGEIVPTKGQSHIVGYDAVRQFSEARKQIGYCPQFDAIFGLMTVREHLEFYARIKKIPKEYVGDLIKDQLKSMNLEQYENKNAGTLSGGNKRKLSVAMAMLGNPPVVFLDEPSAGMDPKARRFMWEIIAKISTRGKNSAVILTTHSMEEAEALSTNMGIMVDGQFKCFGPKQHIKSKFGKGYQVEIKFRIQKDETVDEEIRDKDIENYLKSNCDKNYKVENRKGRDVIVLDMTACKMVLEHVLNNKKIIEEFTDKGFGNEIVDAIDDQGYYPLKELIRWEYVMRNNFEALGALVKEFGSAVLLEQYSPRYRYRVPKGDKSVGYFFSFMEKLKEKLDIDEYSASQTTLEQIFNTFARSSGKAADEREFNSESMRANDLELSL